MPASKTLFSTESFNPLSTGHAQVQLLELRKFLQGFNPLSTGHALDQWVRHFCWIGVSIPYLRVTHGSFHTQILKALEGFNPLSTGHARC